MSSYVSQDRNSLSHRTAVVGNSNGGSSIGLSGRPSSPKRLDNLPYAVEAEISMTPAELDVLKEQYDREAPDVSPQTKFNYAWGLVRSRYSNEQELGVQLLYEIYKENPSRRRECLFYLALGHYRLGQYDKARQYNDSLLHSEPNNAQAKNLKQLISEKLKTDGIIGIAIVSAAVAGLGLLLGSLLKRK